MILIAILRSLALLLRRRVHRLRGDVGRMLTMEDARRFRVFRHVKVDSDAGEPGAVFVIRFTPAHMNVRQNIRFSLLPMIPLLGLHGFREKYWCVDPDSGMCQGIYAWQTHADAEAYAGSVALRFMTRRSKAGSVSHRILDQPPSSYWPFRGLDAPTMGAEAKVGETTAEAVDPGQHHPSATVRSPRQEVGS